MFGIFKKKRKIPEFKDSDIAARDATVIEVRRQLSEYFREDIERFRSNDTYHLRNVAAYASGFLTGYLQAKNDMRASWSVDDDAKYLALCAAVYESIFEEGVGPQMLQAMIEQGSVREENWALLDRFGGTDGIAHVQGKPKQMGGCLLHYFNNNYP